MDPQALLIFAPDGRSLWIKQDARSGGLYDCRTLNLLLPLPRGPCPWLSARMGGTWR